MTMHPYAAGNVAAARREIERLCEELKKACAGAEPEAWRHIGLAMVHAINARVHLDAAFELDAMADDEAAE